MRCIQPSSKNCCGPVAAPLKEMRSIASEEHHLKKIAVLLLFSGLGIAQTALSQGAAGKAAPFRNPKLPIEERVNDLVSRLTLEEKAAQMVHTAPGIPRLGIPAYNWWSEGLHGAAREGYATVFPQAIGLAATFDPDLLKKEADVIATEFRVKYDARVREKGYSDWYHGLTVWSPNINIFRDPRWGRGQETYGEDPFLTAQMGTAYVTGLQGDGKYMKALSTPKHFAVHSGPESTRHSVDVVVSNHDLEDTYLPAFRATVTAGAGSVGNFSSGRRLDPQSPRHTSATDATSNLAWLSTPALFQTLIPICRDKCCAQRRAQSRRRSSAPSRLALEPAGVYCAAPKAVARPARSQLVVVMAGW